jgi:hypothetical protein
MATTIPDVADALASIFTSTAESIARDTRFVQRTSKLTGAVFVQALTFGWLAKPQATLEELTRVASDRGVSISPQGLDQRFTRQAADCLHDVLEAAVTRVLAADPVAIPILQRFSGGVWLLDSTSVPLPRALNQDWPGRYECASVKLQVRLDLLHGTLAGPLLQPGRHSDHKGPLQEVPLPRGALHLADLGYFDLDRLATWAEQDVYWLTRVQTNTRIYDAAGRRWLLPELMATQQGTTVELAIELGLKHRLPCRLLAQRVPAHVAEQRRTRMLDKAHRRNKKIDPGRWALAEWTIYVTNVPVEQLSREEGIVLARCRWQIELLFKLWKNEGHIDESRAHKPWRVLCETYAKLLGMVVQHWILLVSCWSHVDRSLVKASRIVRDHAIQMVMVLSKRHLVCQILELVRKRLAVGSRLNKRRQKPAAYQSLLDLDEPG